MINVRHGPDPAGQPVDIVERKGLGHPDTLADALAERMSVAYSRHCLGRFGAVLHHNLDKLPWLPGLILSQWGPDEWHVCVEAPELATLEDGPSVRHPAMTASSQAKGQGPRLAVRADPAVGPLPLQVVEMDPRADPVPHTAHRHDTRARHRQQNVEQ